MIPKWQHWSLLNTKCSILQKMLCTGMLLNSWYTFTGLSWVTFGMKNENYVVCNYRCWSKKAFQFNSILLLESIASYMFSKNSSHCYCIIPLLHSFSFVLFCWCMNIIFNFTLVLSNPECLIPHPSWVRTVSEDFMGIHTFSQSIWSSTFLLCF